MRVVPRVPNNTIHRAAPRSDSVPARKIPIVSQFFVRASLCAFVSVCLLGTFLQAAGTVARLATLEQKYQDLHTKFVSDLEAVAISCEQSQLESLSVRWKSPPHWPSIRT